MTEKKIINALQVLGFKYVTVDSAGNVWAHKEYPARLGKIWFSDSGDLLVVHAYGLFQDNGCPSETPYIIAGENHVWNGL